MAKHRTVRLTLCAVTIGALALGGPSCAMKGDPEIEKPAPLPASEAGRPEKLAPALQDHMDKTPDKEMIPVILVLERQLTGAEKAAALAGAAGRDDKKERRRRLTQELKRIARAEQTPLLKHLKALEADGQVMHIRSLWLSNVVGVNAPKAVIRRLSGLRPVRFVHLDLPRPVKGAVAWGVAKINADDVWTLPTGGFNGTGVTVAVLDTGVDYTHADLSGRMWINTMEDDGDGQYTPGEGDGTDNDGNGFIDDVIGWSFFGAGTNHPADFDGHGTHVAGIVAGDGAGGTQTGVAPGARIMALKETNTSALSNQLSCWAGMQYALDNGADIVNFSSGWLDSFAPDYATWRNNVNTLMEGGVLFVTIAHNDSSAIGAPNNVRTPGRVPLALTLGGTDNTDAIAAFSNNGPVSWQSVSPYLDYPWPPGLLKPDVSAPGVDVDSTAASAIGGGYVLQTGTSASAPHAAGAAALLLHKNPALTPYELKYLLQETAVDIGTAGPDNAAGHGRIDALAAINASISATPYDLSVTGTSAVWTTTEIWVDNNDDGTPDTPVALSNNHLYARIRNLGGQVVSDVEVKFYFADVSTLGISGFDPDADGDPADGNFTFIGSYRIPTLGPSGSNQETAVAVADWTIPTPVSDHWCVGIGVVGTNPPNATETNRTNNAAFKNFFDIITSTNTFNFQIAPPPRAPDRPFALEFVKQNLDADTVVELLIDKGHEKRLMADAAGFEKVKETLLDPTRKRLGKDYFTALEREIPYVRYAIPGDRATLRGIVSPKGAFIPARIIFRVPKKPAAAAERLLIINTLDEDKKAVGGLTLRLNSRP